MNYQQNPPPPPPPQGYPPQQGYQQGPPQQYQQPYQQQPAQGYGAPQGYGQPVPPQPQGPPPTLDEYYNQPIGGGGPGVKFSNKQVGFNFEFRVARDVTARDLQEVTNPQTKRPDPYSDGRRKIQLVVPLIVGITQEWPEGRATLYAKSGIREALDAGMAAAGCPTREFPKEGDTGHITFTGTQPTGLSDKKLFEVRYTPGPKWSNLASAGSNGQAQRQPDGQPQLSAGVAAEAPQPWQGASPAPPAPQPVAQTPPPPPPPPGAAPQQTAPPPPAPAPQNAAGTPQRPEGMTDEQFAHFGAATTGQAPPPPPPPPGQAPPQ